MKRSAFQRAAAAFLVSILLAEPALASAPSFYTFRSLPITSASANSSLLLTQALAGILLAARYRRNIPPGTSRLTFPKLGRSLFSLPTSSSVGHALPVAARSIGYDGASVSLTRQLEISDIHQILAGKVYRVPGRFLRVPKGFLKEVNRNFADFELPYALEDDKIYVLRLLPESRQAWSRRIQIRWEEADADFLHIEVDLKTGYYLHTNQESVAQAMLRKLNIALDRREMTWEALAERYRTQGITRLVIEQRPNRLVSQTIFPDQKGSMDRNTIAIVLDRGIMDLTLPLQEEAIWLEKGPDYPQAGVTTEMIYTLAKEIEMMGLLSAFEALDATTGGIIADHLRGFWIDVMGKDRQSQLDWLFKGPQMSSRASLLERLIGLAIQRVEKVAGISFRDLHALPVGFALTEERAEALKEAGANGGAVLPDSPRPSGEKQASLVSSPHYAVS